MNRTVATSLIAVFLATSVILADPQATLAGAIESARAVLADVIRKGQSPGVAAAVVKDDRLLWSDGSGFADIERKVPATTATRFGLGSISKVVTMAAAARLADRGTLDLDAPIERYLKDFRHPGKGITIRRIAAHQSGMSDGFAATHYQTTQHFGTVETAYTAIMGEAELTYAPGSKVEYATGLYTIIARAMEVAAGRPYLEIIEREVIKPIGLSTLTPNDPRRAIPNRTVFYMPSEAGGGFEPGPPFDPSHKLAGAGFVATAADVATFGAALLRRDYLSDRMREALFTPVPLTSGEPGSHALGFTTGMHAGSRTVHLPGGGIGISSWLFIHPERRMAIAIMGNLPTAPVGGRTHRLIADAFMPVR